MLRRMFFCLPAFWLATGVFGTAQGEPLRIFYFDWAAYGPFFLAQEKGFYAEEGIEVELVRVADTHAAYAGLFSGQVDAIAAVLQDIPFFATPEEPLVCVLVISHSDGTDGIVAQSDVASIADLRGRSVAYEEGSATQFYLNVVLREAGLSEADIEPVEVPDSDAVQAFVFHEVDAISTWGAMLVEAQEAPGAHLLTDSSEQPGVIVDCLITTPERLEERQPAFEALGRAWDAAVDHLAAEREESIKIMAARLGGAHGDPKIFANVLQKVQLYDGERNVAFFGTPDRPGQVYETSQTAIDVWKDVGAVEFEMKPEEMVRHDVWD